MRPTARFPCSSAGSDHAGRDDLWPPCPISGFPAPEHFETSAMPSQDGLRLNHLSRINKARPEPGHPYEQRAITAAKAKAGWRSPQSDGKLMAEKQILSFKPAPRLELVGYKHSERVQNCKHRSQWCDDSVLQCESRSDGIFGRDRPSSYSLIECGELDSGLRECKTMSKRRKAATNTIDECAAARRLMTARTRQMCGNVSDRPMGNFILARFGLAYPSA